MDIMSCCISDAEAFRQLGSEIECLASLPHDEVQTNHALCSVLWYLIEGQDWALHVQARTGIEDKIPTEIEAVIYSIKNLNIMTHDQYFMSPMLIL